MNGFEKWFSKATQRFEKTLLKLGVFMLLLLFLCQFVLMNDSVRRILLPLERKEGERIEQVFLPENKKPQKTLHMELLMDGHGQGLITVLVNQEEKAVFHENRLLLEVNEGDMIEIDGQRRGEPVTVRIVALHGGIKTPLVGHAVTTFGTNELLGWVTTE